MAATSSGSEPDNTGSQTARPPDIRIGHGYDFHRLEPHPPQGRGRPMRIGGVEVEHTEGPVGHSDGDALLHAITDALLGALGLPDIGQLFPDSSPDHEGQDSAEFLEDAVRRVRDAGYRTSNIDATVVLERPRIGPHKDSIRQRIAEITGLDLDRVNVKGKSHEGMDAIGQGRGIEVHCVALLTRSDPRS